MNSSKIFIETNVSYQFDTEFLSYLMSIGFRSRFQVENKYKRGQVLSFHAESILYSLEIVEKGLMIEAKSFFYSKEAIEPLLKQFGKKLVGCFETKTIPFISLLEEFRFKHVCLLASYFFWPSIIIVAMIFSGLCCFYFGALSAYLENFYAMKSAGSLYLEPLSTGKSVEDYFHSSLSVWKASFLMAFFGSGFGLGFFFVLQFIVYRLLPYFSVVFILCHVVLSLLISIWLWPNNGNHWLLYFLPIILVLSLPMFMFMTKGLPLFIKESKP